MNISVRVATLTDLDSIVSLRMRLFAETGESLGDDIWAKTEQATRNFFYKNIESDVSRSWVAISDQSVVAVGTLAFFLRPPSPVNLTGREAC